MTKIASIAVAEERRNVHAQLDAVTKERLAVQLASVTNKTPTSKKRLAELNAQVLALQEEIKGLEAAGAEADRIEHTDFIQRQIEALVLRRLKSVEALDALPGLFEPVARHLRALSTAWATYDSAFTAAVHESLFGCARGEEILGRSYTVRGRSMHWDIFEPLKDTTIEATGRNELDSTVMMGRRRIEDVFAYQMERLENEMQQAD